ncbi:MAG: aminotransferase class IV [Chitinophagales bacterium]|nr:aminotransferase class IV [Chitinophagales bacterium]MBP8754433.1 aminotransferase class IV [Chitinophagales bacterium]MBP9190026.1 aminotransferase class IV [Chitinophagales bacterium]MBP9548996.1 aminotransferase class IV [Chitinophagales bacterium]MBP9703178.1 aminotransferase class IV [Chitinophagales bacterium]
MLINYNGQFIDEILFSIPAHNRSFLFGDGLFETIKVFRGKAMFFNQHYVRFIEGLDTLKMELPDFWTVPYFKNQVEELVEKNESTNARVRLTFWRAGKGKYTPENFSAEYIIEISPLENEFYIINKTGLQIGVFDEIKKMQNKFSEFKSANAMIYTMAGIYAKENQLDDVLIKNTEGRPIEMLFSNYFIRKDNVLITPATTEGCVNGVMRRVLIKLCRKIGIEVIEKELQIEEILQADEFFITNTIHGIQWVEAFEGITYKQEMADILLAKLNEHILDSMV